MDEQIHHCLDQLASMVPLLLLISTASSKLIIPFLFRSKLKEKKSSHRAQSKVKQLSVQLWTSLNSVVVKVLYSSPYIIIIILCCYEMEYVVITRFVGLFLWIKTIVDDYT